MADKETTPDVPAVLDAHASALDAHAEQIAQHESWLKELETAIGERLTRLESAAGSKVRTPAETDDPPVAKSLAANDDGLQGGHAGPGTGDGPAGG